MKKGAILSLTFFIVLSSLQLFAQVGVNVDGTQPHPSAMLDVKSPVKGFLPPRVELQSIDNPAPIVPPVATGLLIYNTATAGVPPNDVMPGFYFWNGEKWLPVGSGSSMKGNNPGEMLYWNGSAWVTIPPGQHGQQLSFCDGVPRWGGCEAQVQTMTPSNITQRSAVSGGYISSDGGSPVYGRGVCWSQSPNPTIEDFTTQDGYGIGGFQSFMTGLLAGTTYFVRAYATNNAGTSYGNEYYITTSSYSDAPMTKVPDLHACLGNFIDVPVSVYDFTFIGGFTLTLHYNPSVLEFTGGTNTADFPGMTINGSVPGEIVVNASINYGISYTGEQVLFTLHFIYQSGQTGLVWYDNGPSCQYLDGVQYVLDDTPAESFYINGSVTEIPEVGTPVFDAGPYSFRCQSEEYVNYHATAPAADGMVYSLDTASLQGGNNIDASTGIVHFASAWTGASVITATAFGCKGPKTANHVVTVNPTVEVSVTIEPSANPVCSGIPVIFTAIPVNGGSFPLYEWKVNGIIVENVNGPTYEYMPGHNDQVLCQMTTTIACASANPAVSNTITMEVNVPMTVGIIIEASANPVCNGTEVTFTAYPVNGGTNPAYQWKVNGEEIASATEAVYAFYPEDGDSVICELTSSLPCTNCNPATSNAIVMNVNQLLPVGVSISASANPVCEGEQVTFTAYPVNGGAQPSFQWKLNGENAGDGNSQFTCVPSDNDSVICILQSGETCSTGNPATSNVIVMEVTGYLQVGSLSEDQIIVENTRPAELTGTPPLNGTSPVYQMQISGDGMIFTDIEGATSLNYQPDTMEVTTYFRQIQDAEGTCGGPLLTNVVTITVVEAAAASVSIFAIPSHSVCQGTTVTFSATFENGGTDPSFQWQVNGINVGADTVVYSYIPQDGDSITCIMTSNLPFVTNNPATSEAVIMSVNQQPPVAGVTISAYPSVTVCEGIQVTFTATPVNGGDDPVYQWKVNGVNVGEDNGTYFYTPSNGDAVVCILTSNEPCVIGNPDTSNCIIMTVNPVVTAGVSISPSANPVCQGTSVTFTATPVNGGTNPFYQWKVNGNIAGSDSAAYAYIPLNGDVVTCLMTSSLACVTGNPALSDTETMTVNTNNPVSVYIWQNPTGAVCLGTQVTFTAVPTNGGSSPVYEWFVNGIPSGDNSPIYSYTPQNGDLVKCRITSSMSCPTGNPATSNVITMTVNQPLPVSVSIVASANPVVPGTQVTYTATPVNGGSSPSYQWKVNGTNAGTNSPTFVYTPADNDSVKCVLTSSLTCVSGNPATSNTIGMTVQYGIPCPGLPTVSYGNKTYNTVQIGTQCWFRENLDIGTMLVSPANPTDNGIIEKYCFDNLTSYCDEYGGLYKWNEMMAYSTTEGAQGICPTGWHIPTDAELISLSTYLGGNTVAGGKVKETGFVHWKYSAGGGATNLSGFTGLPGGSLYGTAFAYLTENGYFASSKTHETDNNWTWSRSLSYYTTTFGRIAGYKTTAISVRCLKN